MSKNTKNESIVKYEEFEKQNSKYINKLMSQIEKNINDASALGKHTTVFFIQSLKGFKDTKKYNYFEVYLKKKLQNLNYKVRSQPYGLGNGSIQVTW